MSSLEAASAMRSVYPTGMNFPPFMASSGYIIPAMIACSRTSAISGLSLNNIPLAILLPVARTKLRNVYILRSFVSSLYSASYVNASRRTRGSPIESINCSARRRP